jgi:hypothetical protein
MGRDRDNEAGVRTLQVGPGWVCLQQPPAVLSPWCASHHRNWQSAQTAHRLACCQPWMWQQDSGLPSFARTHNAMVGYHSN